jgi:twitching motility two-component system response regulator PilG
MAKPGNPEIKKMADRKDIFRCLEKPFDFNELAWAIIDGLDALDESGLGNMYEALATAKEISEPPSEFSALIQLEVAQLLSQAVRLAEGHHFQQAQKMLIKLLKLDSRNCEGWLWYSRVIGSMKAIESSLKNAIRISPRNLEIIDEKNKFNLVKNRLQAERIRRCPFCWSAVQDTAVECLYCRSHLFIHKHFPTAARSARRGVLKKAITRYTQVISREKNIQAHYYLGMAHLNLEHWEEALDQLKETVKLAPQNKAYTDQLQALLGYMAGPQTGSVSEEVARLRESHPFEVNPADGKNNKVLVVDDSAVARKVVKLALERNGYEIFEATNGLEALTRLNTQRPDLVLLDIIMPGMDGYKTLSLIKDSQELKHIPVIMLTSRDKLFDKIKGKMSGSDEYLTKPFDPDDLVTKVSKYLPR